ncbi:MAG TPA: glycosyltransferase family 4 protein [Gaiellaceae bacterium]|nr:glycosyltransferase family 4 protein [Gaiellaceae bacterium]
MDPTRVLIVCHNHPAIRPGGAEAYAFELHKAFMRSADFEPVFLARSAVDGAFLSPHERHLIDPHTDPTQVLFPTSPRSFDHFLGQARRRGLTAARFAKILNEERPDVVHFQHTQWLGYDFVRVARQTLPNAAIVYTLQEFLPICHHNGQMVRTLEEFELCEEESPLRCHECFPQFTPEQFLLRKRLIQSHLAHADLFITPSEFLRDRYAAWGLPPDKIVVEDYGRLPVQPLPEARRAGARTRIGFFGQITAYKGVDILLEAMVHLSERKSPATLRVHGANLEIQWPAFQARIHELLDATRANVTNVGRYSHEQLPALMSQVDWVVVPSIWWENSPLVIQEAFSHGRPVICSDIGGMAEKVEDGVTGLHFRASDPKALADVIETAVGDPSLWAELRSHISPAYPMDEHVARISELYREVLARRAVVAP